jgi:membrane protease YdiL (CAAX protease family)
MFLGFAFLVFLGEGVTLVFGEVIILLVPLIFLLAKRVNIKAYVQMNFKPKFVLIGLAFGFILILLDLLVTNVLVYFLGTSEAVQQSNASITSLSTTPLGLAAITTSLILAGVCEEFAFRGFLQNVLTRNFHNLTPKYAYIPAMLISAAIFGFFHFDPTGVYIISAFISGTVLGYLYHRWNNYIVPVIAHASLNIIVLVLLMLGY